MAQFQYHDDEATWSNHYLWPPLIALLKRHAPSPARILEIGCGNGATARMLASLGYEVVGFDPSESGIEIAKRACPAGVEFHVGSIDDDIASRFGVFPVVISLEVIEHCPSSRQFMSAFMQGMQPDGVGILSTPYHGFLKNIAVVAAGKFDHHFDPLWEGGHLKFFSIRKLEQLFKEFGIGQHSIHRVGRVPPLAKSMMAVVRR